MPLYEYRCVKCGQQTEKIEKLNGPHLKKCPRCGGKVEAMISAAAIQFKGTGWYVTDYARKGSGGDGSKSDASNSDSGKSDGAGKSEKKETTSDTPAKDTKKKAGPAPKPS